MALIHTDLGHTSAFNSLFLPVVDFIFLVFLFFELQFFFSNIGFGADDYNIFDLIRDIFDLHHDIKEVGFLPAVLTLAISLVDMVLLFTAVFFVFDFMLDTLLA